MNHQLQQSFRALGDPTRRAILLQLRDEDLSIKEVAGRFDISRNAVRKHLKILEEGALITAVQHGKERVNRLNPQGLKATIEWFNYFDRYWDEALASLKSTIEANEKG